MLTLKPTDIGMKTAQRLYKYTMETPEASNHLFGLFGLYRLSLFAFVLSGSRPFVVGVIFVQFTYKRR